MHRQLVTLLVLFIFSACVPWQNDTIISRSGDLLAGEIKSLEKGVLQLKTKYSDKNFRIEWNEISRIGTQRTFPVNLSDGRRLNGSIPVQTGESPVVLKSTLSGGMIIDELLEIIYLKPIESSLSKDSMLHLKYDLPLDFHIELGYTFNYDNKPVAGGSESDFVIQTTSGWEL